MCTKVSHKPQKKMVDIKDTFDEVNLFYPVSQKSVQLSIHLLMKT